MKKTLLFFLLLFTSVIYSQGTGVVCAGETFNLPLIAKSAIGNLNPNNAPVSYHFSLGDVINNTNPIIGPSNYKASSSNETIYVRIEGVEIHPVLTLTEIPALNITASNKPILCKGDTASLTINVSGGSGTYLYSLNGGSFTNNDNYPNLHAGVYNISVLDNVNNCTTSIKYTITEPVSLLATLTTVNQNTIVTAIGGTQPYKYSLNGLTYQNSNVFSNLSPGTYNIVVLDSQGCATTLSAAILPALTFSSTIIRELSCSMDMATISINTTGGKPPYTYSVDGKPFKTDNVYYDLYAGNHTIAVKDALNTINSNEIFLAPYLPIKISLTTTTATCYGENDGKVEVTTTGGKSPYLYSIDNGPFVSSNIFSSLSTSYHTIAVKDATGCSTKSDLQILQPSPITIIENITNAGINNNDGEIKITASGGNSSYTYLLKDNMGTTLKAPQTSNIFSGLSAGSYQVQVTDSKGCIYIRSNINVVISTLTANLIINSITCDNPKGSITVATTGGVPPYQYSLNNGNYTSSNVFNNLTPQTYTVKVRDAQNIRISLSGTVIQSTPLTLSTKLSTPIFCNGSSSGVIFSTPSGGKSPYMYSIDGVTFQSSRYFLDLKAGTYNITTKDDNGCMAVSSIILSEPSPLSATYEVVNDQNIFIYPSGGSNLYTYYLNNTTTGIKYGPETVGTFTKLPPGLYTIMVGDSNDCNFYLSDIKIQASESTALSAVSIVNLPSCRSSGRINVDAMGGKTPYQYSIDNGKNYSSSNIFTNITPGTYVIKVHDADFNITSHTVTINPVPLPPTIQAIVKNITCQGLKNGSITVKGIGGSGNYIYSLNGGIQQNSGMFENLNPGNYTIGIQDMNLCTSTLMVEITEPLPLNVTATIGVNQSITANVTGGSAPYSYSLENENGVLVIAPQTNNIFSNLATGLYKLKVIDANACNITVPNINVIPITELSAFVNSTNITCSDPTGTITINAAGGIQPYQYSLDNGAYVSSNLFKNLAAKNYTIKIKDAQNTVLNLNAAVAQTTLLKVSVQVLVPINCNGDNTGLIFCTPTGGLDSYKYSIDGEKFQSSQYFTNLKAGTYSITIKDAGGCLAISSPITLTDPPSLSASVVVNNQNIFITATGGSPGYGYSLENITTGVKFGIVDDGKFTALASGIYTAKAYDSKGCIFNISDIKIEPSSSTALSVVSIGTDPTCVNTGRVTIIATGGVPPYQYSLNNGDTYSASNVFVSLPPYTYPVRVRDAELNIVNDLVTISPVTSAIKATAIVTNVSCQGLKNGVITMMPTGGKPPYNYSINGGITQGGLDTFYDLSAGIYTISIHDQNVCGYMLTVEVKEPTALNVTATIDANQSIAANVTGGNAPYSYALENEDGVLISPAQTSNTFNNIPVGLYKLNVIDANACSGILNVTINPPAPLIDGKKVITIEFKPGKTLADLVINGQNIKWYTNQNPLGGKTTKSSEVTLPLTTLLVNGTTYYASQTINGIESIERLAVTAKLNGSLSAPDFALPNFRFYPNPVQHTLNIDNTSTIDEIEIISVTGKSVLTKKINNTHSEIDLSNVAAGVYLLKVKAEGQTKTIKIVKK